MNYDDLCIHPDINIPVGYKPPNFDVFDEKGDTNALYLRSYCDKLVAYEGMRNWGWMYSFENS